MTEFLDYSILLQESPDELEREYLQRQLEQNVVGCITHDESLRPLEDSISIAIKCLMQTSRARVEYRGKLLSQSELQALLVMS